MSRPTDNRTVTDWSETEEINTENDATSSGKGKNERSLLFEATLFAFGTSPKYACREILAS